MVSICCKIVKFILLTETLEFSYRAIVISFHETLSYSTRRSLYQYVLGINDLE